MKRQSAILTKCRTSLTDYRGDEIGEISQASPAILYSGDLEDARKEGFKNLREMPERELLENIKEAADYFSSEAGDMGYDEY